MTFFNEGVLVICPEEPQICEDCGKLSDTRPYGPGGSRVCFPCLDKDPEGAQRGFNAWMDANLEEQNVHRN